MKRKKTLLTLIFLAGLLPLLNPSTLYAQETNHPPLVDITVEVKVEIEVGNFVYEMAQMLRSDKEEFLKKLEEEKKKRGEKIEKEENNSSTSNASNNPSSNENSERGAVNTLKEKVEPVSSRGDSTTTSPSSETTTNTNETNTNSSTNSEKPQGWLGNLWNKIKNGWNKLKEWVKNLIQKFLNSSEYKLMKKAWDKAMEIAEKYFGFDEAARNRLKKRLKQEAIKLLKMLALDLLGGDRLGNIGRPNPANHTTSPTNNPNTSSNNNETSLDDLGGYTTSPNNYPSTSPTNNPNTSNNNGWNLDLGVNVGNDGWSANGSFGYNGDGWSVNGSFGYDSNDGFNGSVSLGNGNPSTSPTNNPNTSNNNNFPGAIPVDTNSLPHGTLPNDINSTNSNSNTSSGNYTNTNEDNTTSPTNNSNTSNNPTNPYENYNSENTTSNNPNSNTSLNTNNYDNTSVEMGGYLPTTSNNETTPNNTTTTNPNTTFGNATVGVFGSTLPGKESKNTKTGLWIASNSTASGKSYRTGGAGRSTNGGWGSLSSTPTSKSSKTSSSSNLSSSKNNSTNTYKDPNSSNNNKTNPPSTSHKNDKSTNENKNNPSQNVDTFLYGPGLRYNDPLYPYGDPLAEKNSTCDSYTTHPYTNTTWGAKWTKGAVSLLTPLHTTISYTSPSNTTLKGSIVIDFQGNTALRIQGKTYKVPEKWASQLNEKLGQIVTFQGSLAGNHVNINKILQFQDQ